MLNSSHSSNPIERDKKICIVTHCDINYAAKALSLIKSLINFGYRDTIVLVGHDEETVLKFKRLNIFQLHVYHISELEESFPEILVAKNDRSALEYFYCVTPFLIKFIKKFFNSGINVYLDADTFFFSDFHQIELSTNDYSVAITPHHFSTENKGLEKYGKFNVGLIAFNSNEGANKLLEWWSAKCLQSTAVNFSYGVYGDQKYLDEFEILDNHVKVINYLGCNAAPWNCSNAIKNNNQIFVLDGARKSQLVFFHFSGLKRLPLISLLGFMPFRVKPSRNLKKFVFLPYMDSLRESEVQLEVNKGFYASPIGLQNWINSFRYFDFTVKIPFKTHL
jgi:lipopolysaccharide biosynthesis glycosyltransferase